MGGETLAVHTWIYLANNSNRINSVVGQLGG